ncbi:MAG: hypothetical protein IIU14_06260 [Ruminococcus sp.]|nr:hypothetical protein [Ruminococcus sp.]
MKRIISVLLAVCIICGCFTALGLNASALEGQVTVVLDVSEFKNDTPSEWYVKTWYTDDGYNSAGYIEPVKDDDGKLYFYDCLEYVSIVRCRAGSAPDEGVLYANNFMQTWRGMNVWVKHMDPSDPAYDPDGFTVEFTKKPDTSKGRENTVYLDPRSVSLPESDGSTWYAYTYDGDDKNGEWVAPYDYVNGLLKYETIGSKVAFIRAEGFEKNIIAQTSSLVTNDKKAFTLNKAEKTGEVYKLSGDWKLFKPSADSKQLVSLCINGKEICKKAVDGQFEAVFSISAPEELVDAQAELSCDSQNLEFLGWEFPTIENFVVDNQSSGAFNFANPKRPFDCKETKELLRASYNVTEITDDVATINLEIQELDSAKTVYTAFSEFKEEGKTVLDSIIANSDIIIPETIDPSSTLTAVADVNGCEVGSEIVTKSGVQAVFAISAPEKLVDAQASLYYDKRKLSFAGWKFPEIDNIVIDNPDEGMFNFASPKRPFDCTEPKVLVEALFMPIEGAVGDANISLDIEELDGEKTMYASFSSFSEEGKPVHEKIVELSALHQYVAPEPETTEPVTEEPTEPETTEPVTEEPTEPETTEPETTAPATEPVTEEPTEPETTEPDVTAEPTEPTERPLGAPLVVYYRPDPEQKDSTYTLLAQNRKTVVTADFEPTGYVIYGSELLKAEIPPTDDGFSVLMFQRFKDWTWLSQITRTDVNELKDMALNFDGRVFDPKNPEELLTQEEPTEEPTQPVSSSQNKTNNKGQNSVTEKHKNPVKVSAKTQSVKSSKLKKGKVTLKNVITVTKAQGAVSFKKLSGSKKLSVSAKGVLTVKKGSYKKGTTFKAKIKVSAKGNSLYQAGSKTVTVKVKIK